MQQTFSDTLLAHMVRKELITHDTASQIAAQKHTGFSLWIGEPFSDSEAKRFVARYIERAPLSLKKIALKHDTLTYTTKDGSAIDYDPLDFLGYPREKRTGKKAKRRGNTAADDTPR